MGEVIEYKGYKAEVGFIYGRSMHVMRGSYGQIFLRSDIINATSVKEIYYPKDIETIRNIYIQHFKDKVNLILSGGEKE